MGRVDPPLKDPVTWGFVTHCVERDAVVTSRDTLYLQHNLAFQGSQWHAGEMIAEGCTHTQCAVPRGVFNRLAD